MIDKFADVYVAISPYQYAANNPIKIIDQGGKLLKDKEGNIIATSTGNYVSRTVDGIKGAGEGLYSADIKYEVITIYTDAGRPINALKEMSRNVYVYDRKNDVRLGQVDPSNVGTDCNCHGLSLAGGNIVIEDISENSDAINAILNDDGYVSSTFADASLVTAHDKKGRGGIVHSVLKNSLFDFSADHGEGLATLNVGYPIAMAGSLGLNKSFYKRNSTDKKVDTKSGAVSKGVRTVSKDEIKTIMEKNGLNTVQELIDTIFYGR